MKLPILVPVLFILSFTLGQTDVEPTGGVWRVGTIIIIGSWFRLPDSAYKNTAFFSNTNRGAIYGYGWAQICREYVEAAATALVDPFLSDSGYNLSFTFSSDLKQRNQDFMILAYFDMRYEDVAIRVLQSVFWPVAESMGLSIDRENKTEMWKDEALWQETLSNESSVQHNIAGPCSLRSYAAEFFKVPGVLVPYFGNRLYCDPS